MNVAPPLTPLMFLFSKIFYMNIVINLSFVLSLQTIVGRCKNKEGCLVTGPLISKILCHNPVEVDSMNNVKDILYCFLNVGISRRFGYVATDDGLNSEKTK